jgi:hypothetical protein
MAVSAGMSSIGSVIVKDKAPGTPPTIVLTTEAGRNEVEILRIASGEREDGYPVIITWPGEGGGVQTSFLTPFQIQLRSDGREPSATKAASLELSSSEGAAASLTTFSVRPTNQAEPRVAPMRAGSRASVE